MNADVVSAVLSALGNHSIITFISYFLTDPAYANNPTKSIFIEQCPHLLYILSNNSSTNKITTDYSLAVATNVMMGEVAHTATRQSGWHFSVRMASPEQIDSFSIEEMANQLEKETPILWKLLGHLLASPHEILSRQNMLQVLKLLRQIQKLVWVVGCMKQPGTKRTSIGPRKRSGGMWRREG